MYQCATSRIAPGNRPALMECVSVDACDGDQCDGILKQTKQEANSNQLSKVLDRTAASHNDAPGNDHTSKVPRRTLEVLHDHVTWYLRQHIRDEENGQGHIVIVALHVQTRQETFDLRVANVDFVQVTQQIDKQKHGYEPDVDLPQYFLLLLVRKVPKKLVVFGERPLVGIVRFWMMSSLNSIVPFSASLMAVDMVALEVKEES